LSSYHLQMKLSIASLIQQKGVLVNKELYEIGIRQDSLVIETMLVGAKSNAR
jgi:hypothetical protein